MRSSNDLLKNVADSLNSKGIHVSMEWLIQSSEYVSDQTGLTYDLARLTDKIYDLFLDSDLHECYECEKIPNDIMTKHKIVLFQDKAEVFQVDEIANIGSSLQDKRDKDAKNKDPNGAMFVGGRPLMKLFLTDGVNQMVALDLTGVTVALNGALMVTAGCKLALKAVQVRRGVLLLHGGCCQVLGGEVTRLRSLQGQCKPVHVTDAPSEGPSTAITAAATASEARPVASYTYSAAPSTAAAVNEVTESTDDSMTVLESQQHQSVSGSVNGSVSGGGGERLHESHVSFEYEGDSFDYGDFYTNNTTSAAAAAAAPVASGGGNGMVFDESSLVIDSDVTVLEDIVSHPTTIDLVTPAKEPPQHTEGAAGGLDGNDNFTLPMNVTNRRGTSVKKPRRPPAMEVNYQSGGGVSDDVDLMLQEEELMREEQQHLYGHNLEEEDEQILMMQEYEADHRGETGLIAERCSAEEEQMLMMLDREERQMYMINGQEERRIRDTFPRSEYYYCDHDSGNIDSQYERQAHYRFRGVEAPFDHEGPNIHLDPGTIIEANEYLERQAEADASMADICGYPEYDEEPEQFDSTPQYESQWQQSAGSQNAAGPSKGGPVMLDKFPDDVSEDEELMQEVQSQMRLEQLEELRSRMPGLAEAEDRATRRGSCLSPIVAGPDDSQGGVTLMAMESESEITVLPSQPLEQQQLLSLPQYDSWRPSDYKLDYQQQWQLKDDNEEGMSEEVPPEYWQHQPEQQLHPLQDSDVTRMETSDVVFNLQQALDVLSATSSTSSSDNNSTAVRVRGCFKRVHCFSVELDPFKYSCLVEFADDDVIASASTSSSVSYVAELSSDFCQKFLEVSQEDFMAITDCGDPHSSAGILEMFQQRFIDARGCFWVQLSSKGTAVEGGLKRSSSSSSSSSVSGLSVGRIPSANARLVILDFAPE